MTIRRRSLALAVAGLLGLIPVACGKDEGGDGELTTDTSTTTSTAPAAATLNLEAQMSGKDEVPGPGVTDGVGVAQVRIAGDELCYELNVTMGETPTKAHIHTGAAGAAGPVAVNLNPVFTKGESGFEASESCITPDAALVASISQNPAGYYVNVHSAEHPDGAMRGQLAKAGS